MACIKVIRAISSMLTACPDTPERIQLFNNITSFVLDECLSTDEPLTKRRRVDTQSKENGGMLAAPQGVPLVVQQPQATPAGGDGSLLINMANAAADEVVLLEIKEISVSIPQRKKYDLVFTKNYLYTKQMGTTAPVQGMVYKWDEIGTSFLACFEEALWNLTNTQNTSFAHLYPKSNSSPTTSLYFPTKPLSPPPNSLAQSTSSHSSSPSLAPPRKQAS